MNIKYLRCFWRNTKNGKTELILVTDKGESLSIEFNKGADTQRRVFQSFFGAPVPSDYYFDFGPTIAEGTFGYEDENTERK